MSKLIAAGLAIMVSMPVVAVAHPYPQPYGAAPPVYGMAPPPSGGCFVTTDRNRQVRFWDPTCSKWGSGIRPGITPNDGIGMGD
jgi:hypothetical protein